MTYCVGLMHDRGLVFMSDTRTNAGIDNISTFRKMKIWSDPGRACVTVLSAGNLATTQAVISILEERTKTPDERKPALLQCNSMFEAATLTGSVLQEVIGGHRDIGERADSAFHATLLLGGQIKPGRPRLFMVYPEGNFIEASRDTPFFQIGETKYGRPILIRAYDPSMSFEDVIKLLMVSFDSTIKANLATGLPLDVHVYETDSLCRGHTFRVEADDPYFERISRGWGNALRNAFDRLPAFVFPP